VYLRREVKLTLLVRNNKSVERYCWFSETHQQPEFQQRDTNKRKVRWLLPQDCH